MMLKPNLTLFPLSPYITLNNTDFETDKYELREFLKEYIKDHEVEPNSFLYDFCKSLGLEL